jgi:hypothetical protein
VILNIVRDTGSYLVTLTPRHAKLSPVEERAFAFAEKVLKLATAIADAGRALEAATKGVGASADSDG